MNESGLREAMARHGEALYMRRYAHGSTGNISVRLEDGVLITPTNSCMGRLEPERISRLAWDGTLLAGDKPSKEAFLHLAMYQERPAAAAIVHLHSTYSVAVSCLRHADPADVLPPITAYYVMRIGRLPLLPYYRPGDMALAQAVRACARTHHAMLLANHGPVVAGASLDDAVFNAEELEETARLYLLLRNEHMHCLSAEQVAALGEAFPS